MFINFTIVNSPAALKCWLAGIGFDDEDLKKIKKKQIVDGSKSPSDIPHTCPSEVTNTAPRNYHMSSARACSENSSPVMIRWWNVVDVIL